ncbi:MAG TPA: hypothetical protein VM692_05690 [Gammaproteobacteria bacterium]|nr:hypothetical protein [Gammaproteobacteria bacterium]
MFPLRPLRVIVTLAAVAGFAQAALAGPPLICHPFITDAAAPMLPWLPTRDWHSPDPSYDVARLAADTLKLLSPDARVIDRMENMRRAAIYAERDLGLAESLLTAVVERTKTPQADARAAAMAWFDAGYLLETYRQLDLIYRYEMRPAHGRPATIVPRAQLAVDGYALLRRARAQAPVTELPEIEFAASLMTQQRVASAHRDKAKAGAVPGSLLARNLEMFWTD